MEIIALSSVAIAVGGILHVIGERQVDLPQHTNENGKDDSP